MLYPSSERLCDSVGVTGAAVATGAVLRLVLPPCAHWSPPPWLGRRLWWIEPWTLSPTICIAVTFNSVGENVSRRIPSFAASLRTV